MNTQQQALRLALSTLEANHQHHTDHDDHNGYPESAIYETNSKAIQACQKALAEPQAQGEVVGWIGVHPRTGAVEICAHTPSPSVIRDFKMQRVYTHQANEPAGYKLVPVEPDELWMYRAIRNREPDLEVGCKVWRAAAKELLQWHPAILAAAPEAP
jgi:hypothetical protein